MNNWLFEITVMVGLSVAAAIWMTRKYFLKDAQGHDLPRMSALLGGVLFGGIIFGILLVVLVLLVIRRP